MRVCNYVWNKNNINNISSTIVIIIIIITIINIIIMYTYLALNQLLLPACDIHYAIHEAEKRNICQCRNMMMRRHVVKVMMFMVMSMRISVIQMMQVMQRIRFAAISDMHNFLPTYLPTYLPNRYRVEFWHELTGIGEYMLNDAHRLCGGINVGVSHHILLQYIILYGP